MRLWTIDEPHTVTSSAVWENYYIDCKFKDDAETAPCITVKPGVTLEIINSKMRGNGKHRGIHLPGEGTLKLNTVTMDSFKHSGGSPYCAAIYARYGSYVEIMDSTISNCFSGNFIILVGYGGGLTISESAIINNEGQYIVRPFDLASAKIIKTKCFSAN